MTEIPKSDLAARDAILKLLSDDEVAKVSTAECAVKLADGAEYLDLEQLSLGVQVAKSTNNVDMGHIITRKSVSDQTWSKIAAKLAH